MCGRFILLIDLSAMVDYFQIGEVSAEYKTGYNICLRRMIRTISSYSSNWPIIIRIK